MKAIAAFPSATSLGAGDYVPISQAGLTKKIPASMLAAGASVKAFGAKGDGTTNDTPAFTAAIASGQPIIVPAGTYRVAHGIIIPSGRIMMGHGKGVSIIKLLGNSTESNIFIIPSTSTNVVLRDLTLDGNRASQIPGARGGADAPINISGSHVTLENVEIRFGAYSGVFIGDDVTSPALVKILDCWLHDNGGVFDDAGAGVGIFLGGATPPTFLTIESCLIENNHNTITQPNDSCGIKSHGAQRLTVRNNIFINNYNVNGGQLVVSSGAGGGAFIHALLKGNIILRTGSFGGDQTGGIEVEARGVGVANNIVDGSPAAGIVFEGNGGQSSITDNIVSNCVAAIRLYGNVTDPVAGMVITGNTANNCTQGLNLNTVNDRVTVDDNDFSDTTDAFTVYGQAGLSALTTQVILGKNLVPSGEGYSNERRTAINGSPVSLTTVTGATVISIILPRGVWDLFANVVYNVVATTKVYSLLSSLSLTTNTPDTTVGDYDRKLYGSGGIAQGATSSITAFVPVKRFALEASTTIYLVAYASFDTAALTAYGKISATKIDAIK